MCKEIKRIRDLSQCKHLSKTDRDCLAWALQKLSPDEVSPDVGFDGFDFSQWPNIPSKKVFDNLVKARKTKHRLIMTQSYIDTATPHMHELNAASISVDQALKIATNSGWSSIKANWVINVVDKQPEVTKEIKTPHEFIALVMKKQITNINQAPKHVRLLIETQYRIGNYNSNVCTALEKIGLVL